MQVVHSGQPAFFYPFMNHYGKKILKKNLKKSRFENFGIIRA